MGIGGRRRGGDVVVGHRVSGGGRRWRGRCGASTMRSGLRGGREGRDSWGAAT
jgi:hypothetical protein